MNRLFSVKDALMRPLFQEAVLEAGHLGLEKEIRWVHILELSHIETLIKGGELILSTGIGLKGDVRLQESFLSQLISHGAAGLCIELGTYLDQIPDEMRSLANQAGFPLITFRRMVRFVDITEDLHSIIIKKRSQLKEVPTAGRDWSNQQDWIIDLVQNKLQNEEQIRMTLGFKNQDSLSAAVCLIQLREEKAVREDVADPVKIPFNDGWFVDKERRVSEGLVHFISERLIKLNDQACWTFHENRFVILFFDTNQRSHLEFGLEIESFLQALESQCHEAIGQIDVATGRIYSRLVETPNSFEEALDVLKFKKLLSNVPTSYRRIGIYRLLLQISDSKVTKTFIEDFIQPVIRYDSENQTNLLKTLRVYLGNINSKQMAAKQLYIHRQTFYQRIDKLKELLGEDFMKEENRLNIEIALRAYDLLYPSQEE